MNKNFNQVRIIAGKWRGRKIHFPCSQELRPTQDRIRETLFNWLSSYVVGANCLDLFAGSGALGFEALSRGADFVTFVDRSSEAVKFLQNNSDRLHAENATVICGDFQESLSLDKAPFDIVFLDPPFRQGLAVKAIVWLQNNRYLAKDALVYVESENVLDLSLCVDWQQLKYKSTKSLAYCLFRCHD